MLGILKRFPRLRHMVLPVLSKKLNILSMRNSHRWLVGCLTRPLVFNMIMVGNIHFYSQVASVRHEPLCGTTLSGWYYATPNRSPYNKYSHMTSHDCPAEGINAVLSGISREETPLFNPSTAPFNPSICFCAIPPNNAPHFDL